MERLEERALLAATGLVAAYSFDEGSGSTVADLSGNNNTGTISNATWNTSGKYGNSLTFNGTNSWVTVNDSPSLHLANGMTLEAWVNPTNSSGWQSAILKERSGGLSYALYATDGNARPPSTYINTGGSDFSSVGASVLPANQWTHLAATYDGAALRLYVNGVLVKSRAKTGNILTSSGALRFGGDSIWGEYFAGKLDEIRIYNRALSATEIQTDMNTPLGSVADTTPPTVTSTSPAANATGAATGTNINAVFSESIQPGTVQFVLSSASGTVAGTTSYNDPTRTATFVPAAALSAGTLYSVTVSGAKDLAGNMMTPVTWSFTTATADTTPPTVIAQSPSAGATSVSTGSTVSATFSEAVQSSSISFTLRDASNNLVSGTSAYNSTTHAVTFTPAAAIAGGTQYTASISGATDLAGNVMSAPVNWSFTTAASATDPAVVGQWSGVMNWPLVAINMVQLDTGKILMWDGGPTCIGATSATLWDPATNTFTPVPSETQPEVRDLFCSAQTVLADGRVLVAGGHECVNTNYVGAAIASVFDPATQTWTQLPDMAYRRWYPTATTLPDGRALVTAGADTSVTSYIPIPEVYDPVSNTWTKLTNANQTIPDYAFMFVLPDGRVMAAGSDEAKMASYVLNVGTQTWSVVDPHILDAGSAVMYLPGKIMKAGSSYLSAPLDNGGSTPSAATTYVIDMNQANPSWQQTASMANPRTHLNLTILPDGNVLATGGSTDIGGVNAANAVYAAEMWSPTTQTWSTMASEQVPRLYHSTALLLPDGRVLVAGSGHNYYNSLAYYNAEIYSPPYLFKGARPTITSAPNQLQYNSSFFLQTPDAANIASVSLIRNGAVTHSFNMDQRYVPLNFTQTAGGLTVQTPANANLAPPGYYMLYIVNSNGVPAIAPFVRFPAGYEDTTPPSAPGNVSATGSTGAVNLTWTASTDNVGVTGYNVYRSTTSGFTPSTANLVGQTAATSFTDNVAAGTYYYVIKAKDAAGNLSAGSTQVSATATADTVAPTVSVTAPTNGATLTGVVTLTASASDNVAVAGVQFLLDGTAIGQEITTAPYTLSWSSAAAPNGAHTITARARDAAGNQTTSAPISVTVSNTAAPGLVASYNFDQGSGTVLSDLSGNGLDGTISNATWTTAGHSGGALSFNGTNSWVTINDNNLLHLTTGMTIEAWVDPFAMSGWNAIVLKERTGGLAYGLYGEDNTGRPPAGYIDINGTDYAAAGGSGIPLNTWTHLAATYDGTTLRTYVNGVLVASRSISGTIISSTGVLRIGGDSVWGEYFNGLIDDVRIYNRALSAIEIQTDMGRPV